MRLEEAARKELDRKVDVMIEAENSLSSYAWLLDACTQLALARRIMSSSYVFAFFGFAPPDANPFAADFTPEQIAINQALFEDKQGQLEAEAERLSGLVGASPDVIAKERMTIINLASNINARIVRLFEVIENDIAAQLTCSSLNISAYKGQRAAGGMAVAAQLAAAAAAVGVLDEKKAPGTAKQAGVAQSDTEIIDLTADSDEGGNGPVTRGRKLASSKRLRNG
jgi:hypothetical protein